MSRKVVMVIGQTGQLSRCLIATNLALDRDAYSLTLVPVSSKSVDVTDTEKVKHGIEVIRPDAIINTAAMHHLPTCEADPDAAHAVNVLGPKNIMEHAPCPVYHISTDYVFSGRQSEPIAEGAIPEPANIYGETKLAGERHILDGGGTVFRTASLWSEYGSVLKGGRNFVTTMICKAAGCGAIDVVDNVFMTPTCAHDLARLILTLIRDYVAPFAGQIVHAVNNNDPMSWYDFAREIYFAADMPATADRVRPKKGGEEEGRPMFTALCDQKLAQSGMSLRPTKAALEWFFEHNGSELATTYKGGTSL